jgi:endonuclease/exonuclease/phosphatase (EEP) superfamily protein YafD
MHITDTYWSTIERVDGVRERLKTLKNQVTSSTYAWEQNILVKYESIRRSVKVIKMNEWLQQWESALKNIKKRKLSEADGIRLIRAFLQTVEKI